jgi:hypothetical protein
MLLPRSTFAGGLTSEHLANECLLQRRRVRKYGVRVHIFRFDVAAGSSTRVVNASLFWRSPQSISLIADPCTEQNEQREN